MTITTPHPRRRISTRTKKRCRNIKNFFFKALNSKSETSNKIYSNELQMSISDLKEKISGLETQLGKISKHCYSSKELNNFPDHPKAESKTAGDRVYHIDSNSNKTKVLYKATSSKYGKTDGSENTSRGKLKEYNINMTNNESESNHEVRKSKRHRVHEERHLDDEFHHYKKLAVRHLANIANQKSDKYARELLGPRSLHQRTNKDDKKNQLSRKNQILRHYEHSVSHIQKSRRKGSVVDQDFISNIIKKQYKPIKVFGTQSSDMSHFSTPVCRDKEYSMRDKICYDYDLCSCCFDQSNRNDYKQITNNNVSEIRSVCDARLNNSKKKNRHTYSEGLNDYNNADYYDVVPVKENSNRKTRKRIEYTAIAHNNKYNEVPPSPRTLRPRLNLKAKIHDESLKINHSNECSSTDIQNINQIKEKNYNCKKGLSTLNFENIGSRDENVNESKQTTEDTGKNLAEIKDLLQSFLSVINQSSTHDGNNTKINGLSDTSNYQANATTNINAFPHIKVPPVMPIFPNSCCYPVMPMYPVNYLQSGYPLPNASNSSYSSAKTPKHPKRSCSTSHHNHSNSNSETHELLKEIHDIVVQNPTAAKKTHLRSKRRHQFVTRSVGDSSIASNNNKNSRDIKMCVSKSCEALGCGDSCKLYSNTSFSDTFLERLSVEATRSSTDFNPTFQTREIKTNKLRDIFNPWKWGKKKNYTLEEISEGEDVMDEDIEVRPPPFKQNITNYSMYSQEYYNSPPIKRQPQKIPKQSTPLTSPHFTPRNNGRHSYYPENSYIPPYYHDNAKTPPYQRYHPEGPVPQVPLCLKEIEVKSAGTQSERKMSLFKRFAKKIKVENEQSEKNKPPAKAKSGIFNWKTLKESAKTGAIPKDFTLKTQQQLSQGDTKMKNALIKKLFYKRNPFSPRNLIVKTLLGNDPSSYGNPPKLIRPKYFI